MQPAPRPLRQRLQRSWPSTGGRRTSANGGSTCSTQASRRRRRGCGRSWPRRPRPRRPRGRPRRPPTRGLRRQRRRVAVHSLQASPVALTPLQHIPGATAVQHRGCQEPGASARWTRLYMHVTYCLRHTNKARLAASRNTGRSENAWHELHRHKLRLRQTLRHCGRSWSGSPRQGSG